MKDLIVELRPTLEQREKLCRLEDSYKLVRKLVGKSGMKYRDDYFELSTMLTKWRKEYPLLAEFSARMQRDILKGHKVMLISDVWWNSVGIKVPKVGLIDCSPDLPKGKIERIILSRDGDDWKANIRINDLVKECLTGFKFPTCEKAGYFHFDDNGMLEAASGKPMDRPSYAFIVKDSRILHFIDDGWYESVRRLKGESLFYAVYDGERVVCNTSKNLYLYFALLQRENRDKDLRMIGYLKGGRKVGKKFREKFADLKREDKSYPLTDEILQFFRDGE